MPTDVGEMYRRWTLDSIVELSQSVSNDFVQRYLQYRGVLTADDLANIKSRTGNDPDFPDAAQRAAIYGPILGPSDGRQVQREASRFHETTASVRDAAVKYSERVFNTGEPMLRRAFIDAVYGLQAHLNTVAGAAVERGENQTRNIFDAAVRILRDPAVASAFGLPKLGNDEWPLETRNYDGLGAYLVDEITRMLAPQRTGQITRSRFVVMQRVANHGRETINGVIDFDEKRAEELIGTAYSWATALKDLSGTPIY